MRDQIVRALADPDTDRRRMETATVLDDTVVDGDKARPFRNGTIRGLTDADTGRADIEDPPGIKNAVMAIVLEPDADIACMLHCAVFESHILRAVQQNSCLTAVHSRLHRRNTFGRDTVLRVHELDAVKL